MSEVRVVIQVNALERMMIVNGKTLVIGEDYWNDNIQNLLFPFWSSDRDRLIYLNYFSDGSFGIEKKKYVLDRKSGDRKWQTYEWREPSADQVKEIAELLKEKYFEYQDTEQEIIQEKIYNEYGRWNKVSWEGIRMIRNFMLDDSDWTQMPDAQLSDEAKARWSAYRQKLRNIPTDFSGQDADDVRFPINPIFFESTFKRIDGNGDKEYLQTEDQFGVFTSTTISEYAKRITAQIANYYKIKNPDAIFAPTNNPVVSTAETEEELNSLLETIQNNNI